MTVEGRVVDLINGLDGVRSDIAMMRTPDCVGCLTKHGGELVGEIAQYEDSFRLCYLRGPAGLIVELAERVG
ncbi:hypothetical protein [Amycolatopsis kentuckyensis]|uniref:hypothetical protein n=1 Tax=Amycolatopsis kentuckyensis TaxID=218823 RepID=UPI003564A4CE